MSEAILAQVGIQAHGLSFRCTCHGNPIKTRLQSGFCLLCTSHGPCCLTPNHQVWKDFPGLVVTLSDFLPARGEKKKRNNSQNASLAMSRRSSRVSWSDSSREQFAPSGHGAIARSLTNPRSIERSKRTTNCGKPVSGRKCDRWMTRMQPCTGSQKTIPTLAKPDGKTEELSGASLERDRDETGETSGNLAEIDRG